MDNYSVKKLAKLAGVSVRTLHLYDKMGLLRPSVRTEARYQPYGEKELLYLQQILFHRELDFPLKDNSTILDDPAFNLVQALEGHRKALLARFPLPEFGINRNKPYFVSLQPSSPHPTFFIVALKIKKRT